MNQEQKEIAKKNIIYGCNRGSIAHGTYIAGHTDDIDRLYVYVGPIENYLGFEKYETFEEKEGPYDDVYYEIRHFIKLMSACNPNIICSLWVEHSDILKETLYSDLLMNNRSQFLSRLAYNTFCGYAHDQLKKMDGQGKYLGYMGKERKAIVDQLGYDPKHASHLIRLLTMGIEVLQDGKIQVKRKDADFFINIKNGNCSLSEIKHYTDALFERIKEALTITSLPERPDKKHIEQMTIEIIKSFHHLETIPSHRR